MLLEYSLSLKKFIKVFFCLLFGLTNKWKKINFKIKQNKRFKKD